MGNKISINFLTSVTGIGSFIEDLLGNVIMMSRSMLGVISENSDKVLIESVSGNNKLFAGRSLRLVLLLVLCFIVKLLFEDILFLIVRTFSL